MRSERGHLHLALISALVVSAVGASGESSAPRSLDAEAAILAKGRMSARQKALSRLAKYPDPRASDVLVEQFERYEKRQLPGALWLDLFEAAKKRHDPKLDALLAMRERTLEASRDPLVRFRECLEGGDGEAGEIVFMKKPEAGCARCHSVDGVGGKIGPDLTWLRHSVDRIRLLESLILPNSTMAVGFQSASLKLKDGEEIAGVISLETADELTLTSVSDGKKRRIKLREISERTPLPSPMPPHFGAVLSKREIRDLIEFLAEGD